MAQMEYRPNGKGIVAPMEDIFMVKSANRKGMVLWRILLGVQMIMLKDKKNTL